MTSGLILAASSGVLLASAFPLADVSPVTWVALVPLLCGVSRQPGVGGSFALGYLAGLVWSAGSLFWIHIYHPLALPLVSVVFSLYPGLAAVAVRYLSRRPGLPFVVTVPLVWTSTEYVRSLGTLGFPWLLLGYSQSRWLELIQLSSVTGVFGVGFLIALANGAVADIVLSPHSRKSLCRLCVIPIVLAAVALSGSHVMKRESRLSRSGSGKLSLGVGLVQPCIPAECLWTEEAGWILRRYSFLNSQVAAGRPELIVWPEAAVRLPLENELKEPAGVGRELLDIFRSGGAKALIGSPHEEGKVAMNSAFLVSPEGDILTRYDKLHLVPFGELIPCEPVFGFIRRLVPEAGSFVPGKKRVLFKVKPGVSAAPLICFEGIFGDLVRRFVADGATLLVNITNDDWSKDETAHVQHASMAAFRAAENRRPVVRVGNSGVSLVLDAVGRSLGSMSWNVQGTMVKTLEWVPTGTFYTRHGDLFARLILGVLVAVAIAGVAVDRRVPGKL